MLQQAEMAVSIAYSIASFLKYRKFYFTFEKKCTNTGHNPYFIETMKCVPIVFNGVMIAYSLQITGTINNVLERFLQAKCYCQESNFDFEVLGHDWNYPTA